MLLITLALAADLAVPADYATPSAALAAAQPGDTLVIGPGTHDFDVTQITVTPLTIRGVGRDETTLRSMGTVTVSNTTLYIQDLTYDGLSIHKGLFAEEAHIEVERVHFFRTEASTGAAIQLINGIGVPGVPQGLVVRDSLFTLGTSSLYGSAFSVEGGDGVLVTGSTIGNNISTTRGAVTLFDVEAAFIDTVFSGNNGPEGSAIAQTDGGYLLLEGCSLMNNVTSSALHAEGTVEMVDVDVNSHFVLGSPGVIHIADTGSLVVRDCEFTSNHSSEGAISLHGPGEISNTNFVNNLGTIGGAIHALAELSISDSRLADNQGQTSAGALFATGVLTIEGTSFENNMSPEGGAIQTTDTSMASVFASEFTGNNTWGTGGAVAADGPLEVIDSFFGANQATTGGAIHIDSAELMVSRTQFLENHATSQPGGAIAARDAAVSVRGSWFESNSALWGGGLHVTSTVPTTSVIEHNSFCSNTAVNDGGAIHATGAALLESHEDIFVQNTATTGGVLSSVEASATLDHPHFVYNTAGIGALTRSTSGGTVEVSDAAIAHSTTTLFSVVQPSFVQVGAIGTFNAPNIGDASPTSILTGDPLFLGDPANPECAVWNYAFGPTSSWLSGDSAGQPLGAFGGSPWIDADDDGVAAVYDCDDTNAAVVPGADEICDGIDNNCDGDTDEGFALTAFFEDGDGDGFGGTYLGDFCFTPPGASAEGDDCDDSDPTQAPNVEESCDGIDNNCDTEVDEGFTIQLFYPDNDGDGFGSEPSVPACDAPPGTVPRTGDCDDDDPDRNPDRDEICDGIDNDCDQGIDEELEVSSWYIDADGDGYGANGSLTTDCVEPPMGSVQREGDCDDDDPDTSPDGNEVCDGRDQDCNGEVDDGLETRLWFEDADGDGLGAGEGIEACGPPEGWVDNDEDCAPESASNAACTPLAVTGCGCRSGAIPQLGWWSKRRR